MITTVHNWYKAFQFGRKTFECSDRYGRPVTVSTKYVVKTFECSDRYDRPVTVSTKYVVMVKCLMKADARIIEN